MFGAFDISTSALNAQRIRLDTIASNIANVDTVIGPDGKASTHPIDASSRSSSRSVPPMAARASA